MISTEDKYILGAIIATPLAIMLLNKFYHTMYSLLFPCVAGDYGCSSPIMPGFLTLVASFALVGFAFYLVLKKMNLL